jgi:hypothetical protein
MICGTVGYDFRVGAFAVLRISPLSYAAGTQLLRRARVPMFDLTRAVSGRGSPVVGADAGQQRPAADLACADPCR